MAATRLDAAKKHLNSLTAPGVDQGVKASAVSAYWKAHAEHQEALASAPKAPKRPADKAVKEVYHLHDVTSAPVKADPPLQVPLYVHADSTGVKPEDLKYTTDPNKARTHDDGTPERAMKVHTKSEPLPSTRVMRNPRKDANGDDVFGPLPIPRD
jgi:hypothetical protein